MTTRIHFSLREVEEAILWCALFESNEFYYHTHELPEDMSAPLPIVDRTFILCGEQYRMALPGPMAEVLNRYVVLNTATGMRRVNFGIPASIGNPKDRRMLTPSTVGMNELRQMGEAWVESHGFLLLSRLTLRKTMPVVTGKQPAMVQSRLNRLKKGLFAKQSEA